MNRKGKSFNQAVFLSE